MGRQRYEIIERIDVGGMAEVFKASSTSLKGFEKLVAIKRVLPSLTEDERFVQMFLDEAKIALPLNHANIVQTFDLGLADDTYFIVMEYVDGIDLEALIAELRERGERLDVEEAVYIAREVCKGLAHAHQTTAPDGQPLDIVHRDVSPPNVLLSTDGEVQLTDFGLAKAKSQAQLTDPGVVKGKNGYLSPEAASGEEVDHRTDIFAVGIVMWEMLTAQRLFAGEGDYETLQLVRQADVPPLTEWREDVPEQLRSIIRRALEREPEDRYPSARRLGEALGDFLFELGRPVSSFDLVDRVASVVDEESEDDERGDRLAPEARAAQQELDEFVSVEEMGQLDSKLADRAMEEVTPPPGIEEEDLEDPRSWSDFDEEFELEGDGSSDADQPAPAGAGDTGGDTWEERELGEVAEVAAAGAGGGSRSEAGDERASEPDESGEEEAERAESSPAEAADEGGLSLTSIGAYVAVGFGLALLCLLVIVVVL
ncbi:MAG: serine/threonine protein kinase [Bradymonadaceae bacterium]